jgi:hypothetical protein
MYPDEILLNWMEKKLRDGGTTVSVVYDSLGLQVLKSDNNNGHHSIRKAIADAIAAEGLLKDDTPMNSYMVFYLDNGEYGSSSIKATSIERAEEIAKSVFDNVTLIKPIP